MFYRRTCCRRSLCRNRRAEDSRQRRSAVKFKRGSRASRDLHLHKPGLELGFHFFDVAAGEDGNETIDFVNTLVPPLELEQQCGEFVVEPLADEFGGVPCHDGIGRDVACYDRICPDDGAVSDVDAWENRHILPDPYVVTDDGIALERKVALGRGGLLPCAEDVERVSGGCVHLVVSPVHHEFHAGGNLAELADDELVADKVVMVGDVPLKVLVGKVGEIAHNDVLVFDIGLDEGQSLHVGDRLDDVWVGSLCRHGRNID